MAADKTPNGCPAGAETLQELISQLALTTAPGGETMLDPRRAQAGLEAARPGPTLGRYPVTGHLGRGGMGEVLQVRDPDLGRELAAKVVLDARGEEADRGKLAKFVLEAQVTGQLEHPNIVPLYELGLTGDGRIYFTMKRVEGRTLEAVLEEAEQEEGPRRWAPLVGILLKICDGVAFAHSRGVIHRDLKPENVMVGRFGEASRMTNDE